MTITANLVKELRERTGSGMMDCKKALVETNGDLEAAIDLMRASGATKAAKKAGRIAAEGLVSTSIDDDKKTATIIEVNTETDFVAKSIDFINFVDELSKLTLKTKVKNVDELKQQILTDGRTVEKAREDIIAKIGENVNIRRTCTMVANTVVAAYKHGDRIAVLVALEGGDLILAKDIAMHIAASKPEAIDENQLSVDLINREKTIFIEQAAESGKPSDIIEKMIAGKMKKFIAEVTLMGQSFIKDTDITIAQLLKNNNAKVTNFIRYEVGEGIEKSQDNFVEEVMSQVKS